MKNKDTENIGILKDFYRALSNGDSPYARSVLVGIESVFQIGADAVFKEVIDVIHDNIRDFQIKPKKFFAIGDLLVVLGYSTGRGRITDLKLRAATAHLWTFREGKPVKLQALHDVPAWHAALGFMGAEEQRLAA